VNKARLCLIQNYLIKKYDHLIDSYKSLHEKAIDKNKPKENIIWLCWLQGLENAPEIVKKCVDNVRHFHSEDCTINLVTLENYKDFIQLPPHIEEKFEKKLIKLAHFSDVLRLYLLAAYGGVWIDSTVLILKKLPTDVFDEEFFSLKSTSYPTASTVSYGKWTTFFIKASKDNVTVLFLRDLLSQYWKDHHAELDYFLFDHAISIAYQNFPTFQRQIDQLEFFGNNRYLLMPLLFREYNQEADKLILQDHVKIYKLTYKFDPALTLKENSFYKHYIKS
jgi:hypothetical protein